MKQLIRHIVFLLSTIYPALFCTAQVISPEYPDSLYHSISRDGYVRQVFRLSYALGSSEILYGMDNNSTELSRLASFVHSVMAYPEREIERIRLTGYSSVEGYYATNEQLAHERVYSLLHYLHMHFPELTRYPFDVAWVAEDWEGLSRLVRSSGLNERDEVLEIIRKVPVFDGRESLLIYLNGGRAYREMERTMFPLLRRVEIEVEYAGHTAHHSESDDSTSVPLQEKVEVMEAIDVTVESRSNEIADKIADGVIDRLSTRMDTLLHPYITEGSVGWYNMVGDTTGIKAKSDRRLFSLKTNILPWTGVMPDFRHTTYLGNVALEYYFLPRWSVEVGAMYSYWKYNGDKEFQGISGYRIEPRWWIPLVPQGADMYLGAYARLGDYDIRRMRKQEEGKGEEEENHTGRYRDFGLSAGVYIYLTPAWGIELGARAGYIHSNSMQYTRQHMANWLAGRKGYYRMRVTDLNVSLVYRFR